jgi:hypothetical protein
MVEGGRTKQPTKQTATNSDLPGGFWIERASPGFWPVLKYGFDAYIWLDSLTKVGRMIPLKGGEMMFNPAIVVRCSSAIRIYDVYNLLCF